MATNDNEDAVTQYQKTTKMFYHIAVIGMFHHSVLLNKALTPFAKRMNRTYHTLCNATESWREDEQYKSDPRWNS